MARMRISRHDREGGFTLLEMLVVLVILALVAGLAGARFKSHPGFADEARLTGFLRAQRSAAMLRGTRVDIFADDSGTVLSAPLTGARFRTTQGGVITADDGGRFDPSSAVVSFFMDGSATAAVIRLSRVGGGSGSVVAVNWLTGRAEPRGGSGG